MLLPDTGKDWLRDSTRTLDISRIVSPRLPTCFPAISVVKPKRSKAVGEQSPKLESENEVSDRRYQGNSRANPRNQKRESGAASPRLCVDLFYPFILRGL